MPKPTSEILNPANYPVHVTIPTRWVDMNLAGHISNISIIELLEEARERYYKEIGLKTIQPSSLFMIVSNVIDYLAECFWPDDLETYIRIEKIGNSSFQVRQLALQNSKPIATCLVTTVHTQNGKSAPLLDETIAKLS